MNYPISEEIINFLKSLPCEDRKEHVKQICYLNNIDLEFLKVLLGIFGYSSENFFDE